jgi:hypothetical protein
MVIVNWLGGDNLVVDKTRVAMGWGGGRVDGMGVRNSLIKNIAANTKNR